MEGDLDRITDMYQVFSSNATQRPFSEQDLRRHLEGS